jgi:DNA-directed RNA polymerase subunit beta'
VDRVEKNYSRGIITERERYNQLLDIWATAAKVTEEMIEGRSSRPPLRRRGVCHIERQGGQASYLNPVFLMTDSGARGNVDQMKQLAGMRGLMAKPSRARSSKPRSSANFREGLSVLEYFSSTHGARKGLADTALKTADSGYLTRKLATWPKRDHQRGRLRHAPRHNQARHLQGREIDVRSASRSSAASPATRSVNPVTDKLIVAENEMITSRRPRRASRSSGIDKVMVRSPLTCEADSGCLCQVTTAWTCPPGAWSRKAWPSASSPPSRSASRARS